jgi:hypothetical protein
MSNILNYCESFVIVYEQSINYYCKVYMMQNSNQIFSSSFLCHSIEYGNLTIDILFLNPSLAHVRREKNRKI